MFDTNRLKPFYLEMFEFAWNWFHEKIVKFCLWSILISPFKIGLNNFWTSRRRTTFKDQSFTNSRDFGANDGRCGIWRRRKKLGRWKWGEIKTYFDFLSLFFQKSYTCTVWKFQDFSVTQILREINSWEIKGSKTGFFCPFCGSKVH